MNCGMIFDVIDELNEKYLNILEDVCNLESPTAHKQGLDAVGAYFMRMAEEKGWKVETVEFENAGNPVCITMNPEAGKKAVVYSGHIDTVHPVGLFGTPAVRRDEKNMYGPGVIDCKGGVVASFMAMDALERCGFRERPVKLIIQTDEETSSKNSGKKSVAFMVEKSRDAAAFLNAEPAGGETFAMACKGILRYKFTVHGKAAHSARAVEGANAVAEAAHKIIQLEKLKDLQGITCNCGVIHGGTVANTVAEECVFYADVRTMDAQQSAEAIDILKRTAAHTSVPGCTCELEEVSYRPARPFAQRDLALLEEMNSIFEANGMPKYGMRRSMGGSDATYITEANIPCVDAVGVVGGNPHSVHEFMILDSLAESAKRLAVVAASLKGE